MVAQNRISAVICSTDLERSREFYGQKVGLTLSPETIPNHLLFEGGDGTTLLVYGRPSPNLADHTHFRLFVRLEAAKNQFLLGGKLVAGNDACSVPAQQHRFRAFREDLAFCVAADQKDIDLFWNSATSAHTFWRH